MVDLTASRKEVLADVQNQRDERQIPINQVGVTGVQYPVVVLDRKVEKQHTVARLDMSVDLAHYAKGTHMSRFIEVLNEYKGDVNISVLPKLLLLLKERLGANHVRIDFTFPYFLKRAAPVSGAQALLDYECSLFGEMNSKSDDFKLSVRVPVTALCPCSKQISDYGAHNQRSYVTISVRSVRSKNGRPVPIYIADLIEIAESSASAPVYPLLKRVDERHVTMQAYDNPVFVEDIVRAAASLLMKDDRVARFAVHVENQESIHNHNAFACIEWDRATGEELTSQ